MNFLEFKEQLFDLACFNIYQIYAWQPNFNRNNLTRWVKKGKKPPFPLGKYLIYSTKKAYADYEFKFIAGDEYLNAKKHLINESTVSLNGFALCTGELIELVNATEPESSWEAFVRTFVDYKPDPEYDLWLLRFDNIQRITPVPFKGKQGVGILTNAQKKQLGL
mgnify:CR=1 FL=1